MIYVRDISVNIRYHSKNIRNLNLKHNIRLFMMMTSGEVFVTSAKIFTTPEEIFATSEEWFVTSGEIIVTPET